MQTRLSSDGPQYVQMPDCWFEAYPKGQMGKLLVQEQHVQVVPKAAKQKPHRVDSYATSPELSFGNGTECSCVISRYGKLYICCLTRLHRLCGLPTNDYGRREELALRVELLRVHLAPVQPGGKYVFCLPHISLRYPSASLEYGSIIKLGQKPSNSVVPPKEFLQLNIIRETGYEAYSVHAKDGSVGMALIPNVKTAVMLSGSFGGVRAYNVDDIEESEDEEVAWEYDGSAVTFDCKYCRSFRKWIPVRESKSCVCSKEEVEEYVQTR